MHPVTLPMGITWKGLLAAGLGVKFVLAGAAYVIWAASAVSGAHRREEFLDHTREVVRNLKAAQQGPDDEQLQELTLSLETLGRAVPSGVRSGEEWMALGSVLKFLSVVHAKSTSEAFTDITGRAYTASLDWLRAGFDPPDTK